MFVINDRLIGGGGGGGGSNVMCDRRAAHRVPIAEDPSTVCQMPAL